MDTNRVKVLDMLAEGRISVDAAERLLSRLEDMDEVEQEEASFEEADLGVAAAERPVPRHPKFLRVMVRSGGGDKVNVRVPVALIRTGIRLGALLPSSAREEMEKKGIDLSALSEMDTDELIDALAALTVDVDSQNGDQVRVFCE
jgi:hypothetical protein